MLAGTGVNDDRAAGPNSGLAGVQVEFQGSTGGGGASTRRVRRDSNASSASGQLNLSAGGSAAGISTSDDGSCDSRTLGAKRGSVSSVAMRHAMAGQGLGGVLDLPALHMNRDGEVLRRVDSMLSSDQGSVYSEAVHRISATSGQTNRQDSTSSGASRRSTASRSGRRTKRSRVRTK